MVSPAASESLKVLHTCVGFWQWLATEEAQTTLKEQQAFKWCGGHGLLTLALSGRPQRDQARGRRTLNCAPAARRSGRPHRPLEGVVRHRSSGSGTSLGGL